MLLLTMVSSSAGLLFAMFMGLAYNEHLAREHKVEELESAADLLGTNSTAALVFDDSVEGSRVLQALQTRTHIRKGVLFSPNGTVFAESHGFIRKLSTQRDFERQEKSWPHL